MKNNRGEVSVGIIILIAIVVIFIASLISCNEQSMTKSLGGEMNIDLEPGQKLEIITWKDDELWILTRPMKEDEEPIKWTYSESSPLGILEGTVYIQEYSISENKAD